MRDDFAVCILTHERAFEQWSLEALLESGYNGPWYLIVDDEDCQLKDYKTLYGDNVVVFSKRDYADAVDKVYDPDNLKSVVYARHFLYDWCGENGLKYILQMDDDLGDFRYKYIDKNGKFTSKKIKNINSAIDAILEYMESGDIRTITIASVGKYFGGKNGIFKEGWSWNINQMFFADMANRLDFKGVFYEDACCLLNEANHKNIMIEIYSMCKNAAQIGTNEGGMNELYNRFDEYCRWFIPFIVEPSKVDMKISKDGFKASKMANVSYPKIIRESYKKEVM